jgi:hypothetical protein
MAAYLGQTVETKPVEAQIVAEPTPEPPVLFGPSSLSMTPIPGGNKLLVYVYVGGKGLAEDGFWGKSFNFSFDAPANAHAGAWAAQLVTQYRSAIEALYGPEAALNVMRAIVMTIQGVTLNRPYSGEEIERLAYGHQSQ